MAIPHKHTTSCSGDVKAVTDNRFLTLQEVAAYLNMKAKTLYALVPEISHYKVGRLIRFKKEDVDHWMEQHRMTREQQRTKGSRSPAKDHPVDALVRKAIDEVKRSSYTSLCGKSDRIKSLGKE